MSDFIAWLNEETAKRGWSNNELARRSGMSSANMSNVLNGRYNVTWEFCANVADALRLPVEFVFRKAGLLPPIINPDGVKALTDLANQMSLDDLALLVKFARFLYQEQHHGKHHPTDTGAN